MHPLSLQEFNELPLGDADLVSIAWDGKEPHLLITLSLYTDRRIRLRYAWVDHLYVHLEQGEKQPLCPFSWDVSVEDLSEKRKKALFDFAGQGSISFYFDEVGIEEL